MINCVVLPLPSMIGYCWHTVRREHSRCQAGQAWWASLGGTFAHQPAGAAFDVVRDSSQVSLQFALGWARVAAAPGRLFAADGPVSAEWLACVMRQCPPCLVLRTACCSGARDDSLHSLAESLSQSSITCVGIWISVEDRAGLVYCVEFLRAYVSGRSVVLAYRAAVAQVAMEHRSQAGAAFLLPGLLNGYGKIERRLGSIEGRLTRIERMLSISAEALGIEAGR